MASGGALLNANGVAHAIAEWFMVDQTYADEAGLLSYPPRGDVQGVRGDEPVNEPMLRLRPGAHRRLGMPGD